jgi:DNA (cytosine-5)-methyltransferase 1
MNLTLTHTEAAEQLLTLPSVASLSEPRAVITHWLEHYKAAKVADGERTKEWLDALRMRALVSQRNVFNGTPFKLPTGKLDIQYDCPFPPNQKHQFTFMDLFAGIGGFRLALGSVGGKCLFSSEWDRAAACTYFQNFGVYPFGDINQFTADPRKLQDTELFPSCDLLAAGFPCQPFSRAGVSARKSLGKSHGFDCQIQGTLFFNIVQIVEAKRPKVLFLENVPNLCSHDEGRTFEIIRETIENQLGYSFVHQVINASTLVPQNRKRCYIVCVRDKRRKFVFPSFEGKPLPLSSVLEKQVDPRFTLSEAMWEGHQRRTQRNLDRGAGFTAFLADISKPSNTIVSRYYKDGKECLISQGEAQSPRMLTPREVARLQGFPENYKLYPTVAPAYRQLGNSVAVPVITRIAQEIVAQNLV